MQDFKDVFITFNESWIIFMCLIFAVWLNHETFLPSKLLQTTVLIISCHCIYMHNTHACRCALNILRIIYCYFIILCMVKSGKSSSLFYSWATNMFTLARFNLRFGNILVVNNSWHQPSSSTKWSCGWLQYLRLALNAFVKLLIDGISKGKL